MGTPTCDLLGCSVGSLVLALRVRIIFFSVGARGKSDDQPVVDQFNTAAYRSVHRTLGNGLRITTRSSCCSANYEIGIKTIAVVSRDVPSRVQIQSLVLALLVLPLLPSPPSKDSDSQCGLFMSNDS
jgi:hypothetical protein